jgi:hypothetical protein
MNTDQPKSYFLLCIEKPDFVPTVDNQEIKKQAKVWDVWYKIEQKIETITKPVHGVQRPCKNVWKIPAKEGLLALSDCLQVCRLAPGQKFQVVLCEQELLLCEQDVSKADATTA